MARGDESSAAIRRVGVLWFALAVIGSFNACGDVGESAPRAEGGTGGACKDYVTPDGFTCCCGSTFCSRTAGCAHENSIAGRVGFGAGGLGGTWSAAGAPGSGGTPSGAGGSVQRKCVPRTLPAEPDATALMSGPVPLPDGRTILFDLTCPAVRFTAWAGRTSYFDLAYPPCCLPSGMCGGSTLAFTNTVEGQTDSITLNGPFCTCATYEELKPNIPPPDQQPCDYRLNRDAGSQDAEAGPPVVDASPG